MKKLILIALIGTVFFTSCVKNDSITPVTTVSDAAKSSLRVAYPNATDITWAEVTPTTVVANFVDKKTDLIAEIEKTGKMLYIAKSASDATLPAIALDYLTATYPGYKLLRAGEKKDSAGVTKGFMADIQVAALFYHIHFDATGKFLTSVEKNGLHKGKGVVVLEADLLPAIKTYLTTTYPGYKFNDAVSFMVDGVAKGYGVRITTTDAKEIGLLFDTAGVFLRSREGDLGHGSGVGPGHGKGGQKGGLGKDGIAITKVEKTALPAAILTYLNTNYAGYTFNHANSIAVNGVLSQYVVDITATNKKYHVIFDATGVFVKVITKK